MPEVFGLHENADISKDAGETSQLLSSLILTGSRSGGGASSSEEEVVKSIVDDTLKRLPQDFDMELAQTKFPVRAISLLIRDGGVAVYYTAQHGPERAPTLLRYSYPCYHFDSLHIYKEFTQLVCDE